MSIQWLKKSKRFRDEAGIALLTTLLLLFLMSSLLVGFSILLISNQQLAGSNNDDVEAFYGAEAGMEQLTANLGNLFAQTYSPTLAQVNAVTTNPPAPTIPGISFTTSTGASGYTIALPPTTTYDSNGNPIPATAVVSTGPYTGLTAFITEYTLTVNTRTPAGREVKLQRTTQTVGIPAFSFGVFASMDLSFFPGPNFNFGGRTHTNGNLWLAAGSTLTLSGKVDAYKDVIRTSLENGFNTQNGQYAGTVEITTDAAGTADRALAFSEGSYDPIKAASNSGWPTISTGPSPTDYNHLLINGLGSMAPQYSTGADQLNLGVALVGNGATQPVDLIRRPLSGESMTVTAERYSDQASLRIFLSDNPADITNLPCVTPTAPFDLSQMATLVSTWPSATAPAALKTLYTTMTTKTKVPPLPLAASGATGGAVYSAADGYWQPQGYPVIKGFIKIEEQTSYGTSTGCGSWTDVTNEILSYGYVGRNIDPVPQSLNGTALNPQWPITSATQMAPPVTPALPVLPTAEMAFQNGPALKSGTFAAIDTLAAPTGTCLDPHPFAIIRLERVRDNPSSVPYASGKLGTPATNKPLQSTVEQVCGYDPSTKAIPDPYVPTGSTMALTYPHYAGYTIGTDHLLPTDFWPNHLFDTREGELRDTAMSTLTPALPTLNGTMTYIEIDISNLTKWFAGTLITGVTGTGPNTKDPSNASNDFTVYISDRRGNYEDPTVQTITGGWPPLSFTKNETGESGWTDIVNGGSNAATGCPNDSLDTGEDENTGTSFAGSFYYYGAGQKYIHGAVTAPIPLPTTLGLGQLGIFKTLSGTGIAANSICAAVPVYSTGDNIWPMMVAASPNAPRENPPLFFRRAIKLVNGNNLTALSSCPGGNPCGLTIATENPAYVQGDYNSNSAGGGFNDPFAASSIAADAVTFLSDNWSDINSFSSPYSLANRNGVTTYYRMAVLAGVTVPFPQPGGTTTGTVPQDFGTDGGVHNFLRYVENWGGTLNYLGSIVELYYSRQANGAFKCCTTVYSPPTRGYSFDTDFLNPLLLPPRTPLFRDVNTTGWTRLMLPSQ
jgi:hypothetical protein